MTWFPPANPAIHEIIDLNARWRAHQEAVICAGTSWTWSDFRAEIARFASALEASGLEPKARVVVLMRNGTEMLTAMFGAIAGGYVAVPLNVAVSEEGLDNLVRDSKASAIVASHEHIERIENLRERLPTRTRSLLIGAGELPDGWHSYDEFVAGGDPLSGFAKVAADDPCNVIYSSGTTGLPKGIVHSHACRMAWAYDMTVALRYSAEARTLLNLGLFSNITWVAMLNTVLCGGTLVISCGFSVVDCLETIARLRITHSAMVPVQFQKILECPEFDDYDLTSLVSLMCCGSPLQPALKLEILERIPGDFIELYGLTEGIVTIQDPVDAWERPESVGKPCPGQDIRLLGGDDKPVATGEAGEIVGFGRLMMSGYLNRDDANEEATWTDEQGRRWLRTGDIGKFDEDGNLYLVDRKKDMIISGGQNIYPADIESVMAQHPDLADVAVVGVASKKWGETPLAVVVAGDTTPEEAALLEWTNSRVGKQQRIAGVRFVDELPRNPNGKVLKRELRKRYADLEF